MTVSEKIHNQISSSVGFLLEKIKRDAFKEYAGDLDKNKFVQVVNKYTLKYPQNPFITHKQVEDICIENDLKLGSQFAFIGEIPEVNQKEIENFVSPNEKVFDETIFTHMTKASILKGLSNDTMGFSNLDWDIGFSMEAPRIVFSGSMEGYAPNHYILPIHPSIAIHHKTRSVKNVAPCNSFSSCFDYVTEKETSIVLQDQNYSNAIIPIGEYFCHITAMSVNNPLWAGFPINSAHEFNLMTAPTTEVQVSMDLDMVCRDMSNSFYQGDYQVDRKVIAPGELFNTTSLKEIDGYRFVLDELAMQKQSVFVDDPIILEPVEGGYLVITQWGVESGLINQNNN